jgi:hypothetical protein
VKRVDGRELSKKRPVTKEVAKQWAWAVARDIDP